MYIVVVVVVVIVFASVFEFIVVVVSGTITAGRHPHETKETEK